MTRGTTIVSTNAHGIVSLEVENGILEDEGPSGYENPNDGLEEEALEDSLLESDAERDNLSDEKIPSNPIDAHDEVSPVSDLRDQEHRGSEPTLNEWVRQPRRSRRIRWEDPTEVFVDADVNQEGVLPEDVPMFSMLQEATGADKDETFDTF